MTDSRTARAERGFSMFLVIMAMFITAMFVAAGFAAANGDLALSGQSKDRKGAYAAAEAGLNYYLSRLNRNPDYWTLCDTGPAPAAGELNPVNQPWTPAAVVADPRDWRNLKASGAQYTVELLPANGKASCVPGAGATDTMIDKSTGTFRVRATGRTRQDGTPKRSLVATFRRDGFLNFLWFTDFEDLDPQAEATQASRDSYDTKCGEKYRPDRSGCDEISFISGDAMKGPMHTNDSFLFCGLPQLGRTSAQLTAAGAPTDVIEVSGHSPGYYPSGSGCGTKPDIQGAFATDTKPMKMPPTNDSLETTAVATGFDFPGKTFIRFNGDGQMTVTFMDTADPLLKRTITRTYDEPDNGVIYAHGLGVCTTNSPRLADYNESNACGNIYVSGTYTHSMTIAAANDIIVRPTGAAATDADLTHPDGNDSVLGLIANNFVRVFHACTSGTNQAPVLGNLTIQAAILSLQHSFILDNHDCGAPLGTLTVKGVIAQKYRGTVSTHSSGLVKSGYLKDYNYDDRLKYRSPPYFLNPVDAAWRVVKVTEQVPAT